jgi:molybdate transport system substrate-binding protein
MPTNSSHRVLLGLSGGIDSTVSAMLLMEQGYEVVGVTFRTYGDSNEKSGCGSLAAVEEASCEVGTTYLSDTIGHEDGVKILEVVGYDVTGNIIYPVAQITNPDADDAESAAAADFIAFISNDDAKALYQQYGFDTNVE